MEEHEHLVRNVPLPDGRTIRVRSWPGRGRPLVLLHGLFDDSTGWSRLAAGTARPCIAVDLPGFGGSDLPTSPRIGAYADDVAMALSRMRLEGVTLVGHSFGGGVAAAVAERTGIVAGLALLAPVGFGPIRIAEAFALPVVSQLAEAALPFALISPLHVVAGYTTFVAHRRMPSRDLMGRLRRRAFRSAPGVRAATLAVAAAGRAPDGFAARTIDYAGPAAALWGDRDALVPVVHARALRRALPQAYVEVWGGMGHHPQRERPEPLQAFIEEHAAPARGRARRRAPVAVPLRAA